MRIGGGGNTVSVAVADYNGDGIRDLAVGNGGYQGSISILLGNGDGTFQRALYYYVAGAGPVSVAAGDFNGRPCPRDFLPLLRPSRGPGPERRKDCHRSWTSQ
jgi:hypothetical protein